MVGQDVPIDAVLLHAQAMVQNLRAVKEEFLTTDGILIGSGGAMYAVEEMMGGFVGFVVRAEDVFGALGNEDFEIGGRHLLVFFWCGGGRGSG